MGRVKIKHDENKWKRIAFSDDGQTIGATLWLLCGDSDQVLWGQRKRREERTHAGRCHVILSGPKHWRALKGIGHVEQGEVKKIGPTKCGKKNLYGNYYSKFMYSRATDLKKVLFASCLLFQKKTKEH